MPTASRGFKVALVTDGRMSGASGKIPAAIHVTPESSAGGPLARIRDGDLIKLDARNGQLEVRLDERELQSRPLQTKPDSDRHWGLGRELFDGFRQRVNGAEQGAMSIFVDAAAAAAPVQLENTNEY